MDPALAMNIIENNYTSTTNYSLLEVKLLQMCGNSWATNLAPRHIRESPSFSETICHMWSWRATASLKCSLNFQAVYFHHCLARPAVCDEFRKHCRAQKCSIPPPKSALHNNVHKKCQANTPNPNLAGFAPATFFQIIGWGGKTVVLCLHSTGTVCNHRGASAHV